MKETNAMKMAEISCMMNKELRGGISRETVKSPKVLTFQILSHFWKTCSQLFTVQIFRNCFTTIFFYAIKHHSTVGVCHQILIANL